MASLRSNQSERQTDVEFALEEQKVYVQELETKLNLLQTAKSEDLNRLEQEIKAIRDSNLSLEEEKVHFEALKNEHLKNLSEKSQLIADLEAKLAQIQEVKLQEVNTLKNELDSAKELQLKSEQTNSEHVAKIQDLEAKLVHAKSSQSDQMGQIEAEMNELKATHAKLQQDMCDAESAKTSQIGELVSRILCIFLTLVYVCVTILFRKVLFKKKQIF